MNAKVIGEKLLKLRGNNSRDKVALDLEISISALQMYENGKRIPRDEIKVKIAGYYGVTVQELFFEDKQHKTCGIKKEVS
ncbi:helix-turn-helix transcriptional regulator [Domibacillus sp.]|uniref:helix-turn-helix transcriptional regulator n=1 Tax=Domibacillus sp. TaxID=1969783 RepID=UPI0028127DAB|nr:helix-turn-helix transcriptional regulator [Domibacillus sp.]